MAGYIFPLPASGRHVRVVVLCGGLVLLSTLVASASAPVAFRGPSSFHPPSKNDHTGSSIEEPRRFYVDPMALAAIRRVVRSAGPRSLVPPTQ